MRKVIFYLSIILLLLGLSGCNNNTDEDDGEEVLYKVETGVITNTTYNSALSKIETWSYVDYAKMSSLRLYLYNNTVSDHEIKMGVKLSEIKEFMLKYFSQYEVEQEIAFLKKNGNDIAFFETIYGADKKAWIYATK